MPLFALEQIVLLSFAVRENAACYAYVCVCVCVRAHARAYYIRVRVSLQMKRERVRERNGLPGGGRTRKSKKEERKYT